MRFIIRARMPTEAGNKALQDPNFIKNLEDYMKKAKPEAAYFFEDEGEMGAAFVVDMQSSDQMPVLAEPLFIGLGAKVEFHPAMNFEELKRGAAAAADRTGGSAAAAGDSAAAAAPHPSVAATSGGG
jgi:hypothetical protein